jgi:hypothetical protein
MLRNKIKDDFHFTTLQVLCAMEARPVVKLELQDYYKAYWCIY